MKKTQTGEKHHHKEKGKETESGPADQIKKEETSKVDELEAQLGEKKKEAAENFDKYLRSVAELDNYRKRAAKDRADYIKFANENLLRDLLGVLDNLERAREHTGNSSDMNSFLKGLDMIQGQFRDLLSRHGVEKIETAGREFDPNLHEAVMQVPGDEETDNKVVEEFSRGYILNGRLLRPAKVSVAINKKK